MDFSHRPSFLIRGLDDLDALNGFLPTRIVSMIEARNGKDMAKSLGIPHLCLAIPDKEGEGTSSWAISCAKSLIKIGRNLDENDRVLIHCLMGVSRSSAAALIMDVAWHMEHGHADLGSVVANSAARLKSGRPNALPNGSLMNAADMLMKGEKTFIRARSRFLIPETPVDF